MAYLTDAEIAWGAAQQDAEWGDVAGEKCRGAVRHCGGQLNTVEPDRVNDRAPDPSRSDCAGEEGPVPIMVHHPHDIFITPRRPGELR